MYLSSFLFKRTIFVYVGCAHEFLLNKNQGTLNRLQLVAIVISRHRSCAVYAAL